jgi:Pentapeptide repeats (8 copies)
MAERPEARTPLSGLRGLVGGFLRLSDPLSRPENWARLLMLAIALVTVGLVYGFVNPWESAIVGVWVAIVGGILLLYGCLFVFPGRLTGDYQEATGDHPRVVVENEIRSTLLQALLAAVVLIGAVFTWQQFSATAEGLNISRHTQITEQFSNAADQLGAERIEVRIGAVHTLDRLTMTAAGEQGLWDNLTVYQLLAAYVKAQAPLPPRALDADERRRSVQRYKTLEIESLRKRAPDVQKALEVVGARDKKLPTGREFSAFLADTDLRGADLANLRLNTADLRGSRLDYASGRLADNQQPAELAFARLQGATLRCAHLESVNLSGARLQNADLRDAVLTGARGLETAKLDGARYNDRTLWPKGFDPTAYGMKRDWNHLVVIDGKVVTVQADQSFRKDGKQLVQGRYIVPRISDPVGLAGPAGTDEAQPLTCSGPGDLRIGVTKCPPRDDRDCKRQLFAEPDGDAKKG